MCGLSPSLFVVRFPHSGLCPQAKPRGTQGNQDPSRLFLVLLVCSEFEQGTNLDRPEERDSSDSEELETLHIPGIGSRSVATTGRANLSAAYSRRESLRFARILGGSDVERTVVEFARSNQVLASDLQVTVVAERSRRRPRRCFCPSLSRFIRRPCLFSSGF
jgi:hypothetical protein